MTTIRRYTCNLCRSDLKDDSGKGVYWKAGAEPVPVSSSEDHLCFRCIQQIRSWRSGDCEPPITATPAAPGPLRSAEPTGVTA